MTLDEVKDDLDMAEVYPGSMTINWNEVGFRTIAGWVEIFNWQTASGEGIRTEDFDIESIKGLITEWWLKQSYPDAKKESDKDNA